MEEHLSTDSCKTGIIYAQEDQHQAQHSLEWVIVTIVTFPLGKETWFLQLDARNE